MIQFLKVSKTFNPSTISEVKAVKDISLTISKGEFLILIGSNGSGKSSFLNLISGEIIADEGQIFVDKVEITQDPEYRRSRWIAHIFQDPSSGTATELSILDNFRLATIRSQQKGIKFGLTEKFKNKVCEKLEILGMGLENKLNQPMGTLSGGQRQALTLLMATMDEAKVLLLDEPTAALDVKSSKIIMNTAQKIIRELNLTAILITHNLKDVIQYGDRIIQMSQGEIIKDILKVNSPELKLAEIYSWMDKD